jgi:Family of unknown function (DUF6090)
METGKTTKYFKYAIGEIILVMIGILFALQVNEWNNKRQESSKEQLFLKNLQTDFNANIIEFNKVYKSSAEAYIASNSLLEIIKKNDAITNNTEIEGLIDTIINDFSSLDLTDGSINEIINTGSLNIIKDQSLRSQLSKWSQTMNDMNDDIKITNDYLFNKFIPSLKDKSLLRNIRIPQRLIENTGLPQISKSNFEIDYSKTIMNYPFENQVYFNALNCMFTLDAYKITEAYLIETLELIEDNIKH